MRKKLAILFIIQAVLFVAVFVALLMYGGDEKMSVFYNKSVFFHALMLIEAVASLAGAAILLSKVELLNDRRLLLFLTQLTLSSLATLQFSLVMLIPIIPLYCAHMFWREG